MNLLSLALLCPSSPSFLRPVSRFLLPCVLVVFVTAFFLALAPNSPAQEASEGEEYEQTLFGLRRVDKSKSGTATPVAPTTPTPAYTSPTTAPTSKTNYSNASSPFRGTTWSFIDVASNRPGIIEFRADSSAHWVVGAQKGGIRWQATSENSVFLDHESDVFYLRPDKQSLMQSTRTVFRLWYRGTRPPAPSSDLRSKLAGNIWENKGANSLNSIYEFGADGSFIERWNGKVRTGRWAGLYGDAFKITYTNGQNFLYSIAPNGEAILRSAGGYNGRYWIKRSASAATASSSATPTATASSTTATPAVEPPASSSPRTLEEEFSALEQMRASDFAKAITATNTRDKRVLEELKRQVGTNELTLLEKIQTALVAVANNDTIEAEDPARNKQLSRNANALWRIKFARERELNENARSVGRRYKSAYGALKKRAVSAGDLNLAKQIRSAELRLPFIPGISPFIGFWRPPGAKDFYVIRPNGVVSGRGDLRWYENDDVFMLSKGGGSKAHWRLAEDGESLNGEGGAWFKKITRVR